MKIVSNDGTKANIKVTEAEVQQIIYTYERLIKTLREENKQLKANRDEAISKEEIEKLLKEFQELDKCDNALTSSLMLRRKTFENEILKKKVKQLESNRDEALNLMEKCKFDKTDKYIAISEYKEYQELKAILERGKE